ncbi:hypothetical protein [Naasia lichenicola]|uniref:SAM-dependent methyltransferase n=1 Tax=Naasia lichenicola TaxID=2565933 RepID=A0A4S4FLH0_9MICO|nr:hypothetical protein [Naasia lichenicola]THG31041.1 hypothetical protein E6C64_10620 [Naasia lichenicola]
MAAQTKETYEQTLRWLESSPSLDELCERFPSDWNVVADKLDAVKGKGTQGLHEVIGQYSTPARQSRDRQLPQAARMSQLVQRRMVLISLRSVSDRRESGVQEGAIRFGLIYGFLLQRTLFKKDLERKPVHLGRFGLVWRLSKQRNRLMPLVRPQGIYCFYSRTLIKNIVRIIDGRDAVEIAAGDGTLTGFLNEEGASVIATDDFSWSGSVSYPESVQKFDARAALQKLAPRVAICSWPPAGNPFEKSVFVAPSVETYIVITSTDEREASNWATYREQTDFELDDSTALDTLVFPPGRNRVLVFRRRGANS